MKIIIIGAGPGGYETAIEAAGRGIEVILIEKGDVGGTCLNEGCIPTKVLCRSAEVLEETKSAYEFGVCIPAAGQLCGDIRVDFAKVRQRKADVVRQLRSGVQTLLDNKLITLVYGRAELKDAHTVTVYGAGAGDYSADYIIVATGSSAAPLMVPGGDLPGLLTSRELLDIDHIPESLCIVGAGVIGLEFASVFNSFGTKVTVVEYCPQILPRFDSDLAKRLKQSLSKRGIDIITSAAVQSVSLQHSQEDGAAEGEGHLYRVEYECKSRLYETVAEKVLVAVGRKPAVDDLGLENVCVEYGPKGIRVDENMQTTCPSVYAIGDVNGKMMLAHVATYQGLKALNHICGKKDDIDMAVVPSAVFTMPEAASVGMTEDECKEKGIVCRTVKSFFRANGKAVAMGQTDGLVKTVVAEDGHILGCHIFGPHSADLIGEMTALISKKSTVDDIGSIIHAHPTLGEVFRI